MQPDFITRPRENIKARGTVYMEASNRKEGLGGRCSTSGARVLLVARTMVESAIEGFSVADETPHSRSPAAECIVLPGGNLYINSCQKAARHGTARQGTREWGKSILMFELPKILLVRQTSVVELLPGRLLTPAGVSLVILPLPTRPSRKIIRTLSIVSEGQEIRSTHMALISSVIGTESRARRSTVSPGLRPEAIGETRSDISKIGSVHGGGKNRKVNTTGMWSDTTLLPAGAYRHSAMAFQKRKEEVPRISPQHGTRPSFVPPRARDPKFIPWRAWKRGVAHGRRLGVQEYTSAASFQGLGGAHQFWHLLSAGEALFAELGPAEAPDFPLRPDSEDGALLALVGRRRRRLEDARIKNQLGLRLGSFRIREFEDTVASVETAFCGVQPGGLDVYSGGVEGSYLAVSFVYMGLEGFGECSSSNGGHMSRVPDALWRFWPRICLCGSCRQAATIVWPESNMLVGSRACLKTT
ncbi:hypothetical protein JHW43_006184 [Diplocarpon mali]|nr:hypothetical protein JHW43_006184 [Diplocarpon mali]